MLIDNTNLLAMCRDCGATGFVPAIAYAYDAGAGTVVVTNTSTIPAGDTLNKVKAKVSDMFGNEAVGYILVGSGGEGYESAPTVVFAVGTGATGTAVLTNGRVTSVTIGAGGSGYTTGDAVTFTGGGGVGAVGTVVAAAGAVTSVVLTADNNNVSINVTGLNRSKPLALTVAIHTTEHIAADGGAYGLQAAGTVENWDVQKNA